MNLFPSIKHPRPQWKGFQFVSCRSKTILATF